MKKTINDVLKNEKKAIIANDSLANRLGMEVWDKVVSGKHITIRTKNIDYIIESVKKMPLLTFYNNYPMNVINQLQENEQAVEQVADFVKKSTTQEFNFFLSQMYARGNTADFVNDYLLTIPKLRNAIDAIIAKGEIDKVKAVFAFTSKEMAEFCLTSKTHPNSFPAYAEGRTTQDVKDFLTDYINFNVISFNSYLSDVQKECLDYSSPAQFFKAIERYNELKQFDYDNQIKTPQILFKGYFLFKNLNERKVWETNEMFSINKFVKRDELRRKYDDFSGNEESKIQKLYKEIFNPDLDVENEK